MDIFVSIDGQEKGPYALEEVREYLASGNLHLQTPAWREGMKDWQPLGSFPEFSNLNAGEGRAGPNASRTPIYAAVAVVAVALIVLVSWVVLRGRGSATGPLGKAQNSVASPSPSAAASVSVSAGAGSDPSLPQTLEDLNEYYQEPPAGQNAATFFLKGFEAMQILPADGKSPNLPVLGQAKLPALGSPFPGAMRAAVSAVISVSMKPGAIALTVTPYFPSSIASVLVNP